MKKGAVTLLETAILNYFDFFLNKPCIILN